MAGANCEIAWLFGSVGLSFWQRRLRFCRLGNTYHGIECGLRFVVPGDLARVADLQLVVAKVQQLNKSDGTALDLAFGELRFVLGFADFQSGFAGQFITILFQGVGVFLLSDLGIKLSLPGCFLE